MAATLVPRGASAQGGQTWTEQVSATQASVDADTVLAGSAIDIRGWRSLSYTLKVATNDVDWTIYGANLADFSDETAVQAEATVVAGAAGSYAVAQAPFGYYRVRIHSHVGGAHGTATLNGMAKA